MNVGDRVINIRALYGIFDTIPPGSIGEITWKGKHVTSLFIVKFKHDSNYTHIPTQKRDICLV